jgi:long-chain acyl-CoA synthetase
VLFEHPAVADVAVIGLTHPLLGEEVAAVVQAKEPVAADDLKAHVAQRLAAFKVPVEIFFRDEPMPRNATGKILKRSLRDEYDKRRTAPPF